MDTACGQQHNVERQSVREGTGGMEQERGRWGRGWARVTIKMTLESSAGPAVSPTRTRVRRGSLTDIGDNLDVVRPLE